MNTKKKGLRRKLKCVLLAKLSEDRRVAGNSQWVGYGGGLGAEPPALENFAFFRKCNLF